MVDLWFCENQLFIIEDVNVIIIANLLQYITVPDYIHIYYVDTAPSSTLHDDSYFFSCAVSHYFMTCN